MFYAAHISFSEAPFEVTFAGTKGEIEAVMLVEADDETVLARAEALARGCDGMTLPGRLGQPVVVSNPWVRKIVPCLDRDGQPVARLGDGVIAGVMRLAAVTERGNTDVDLDGLISLEG